LLDARKDASGNQLSYPSDADRAILPNSYGALGSCIE
jgi:hypothetical protein